jgi:hypothetical protein
MLFLTMVQVCWRQGCLCTCSRLEGHCLRWWDPWAAGIWINHGSRCCTDESDCWYVELPFKLLAFSWIYTFLIPFVVTVFVWTSFFYGLFFNLNMSMFSSVRKLSFPGKLHLFQWKYVFGEILSNLHVNRIFWAFVMVRKSKSQPITAVFRNLTCVCCCCQWDGFSC